jgi:predicted TIM-barrel fold metal-dependent hydrolase
MKVSAIEFLSRDAPAYRDLDPIVAALAGATDRLLWGTDWPHGSVTFTGEPMPDDGALLDLVARWFPAESDRRRILVTNPAQLYDFPISQSGIGGAAT